jgi:hypothetical protein
LETGIFTRPLPFFFCSTLLYQSSDQEQKPFYYSRWKLILRKSFCLIHISLAMLCLRQLLLVGVLTLSHVGAYDLRNVLPSSTTTQNSGPVPTAPAAIPARTDSNVGVWTSASVQEIVKERDEHVARGDLAEIEKRDQYIFALCPEAWAGGLPKACSECGNDTIVPGQCDQIMFTGSQQNCPFSGVCGVYCQCIPGAVDITPGKVTSITTVDGQAGTVVYEPLTLAEYSG